MVVTIKKNDSKKEVESALKSLKKKVKKPVLSDFYGKLKGSFGDGLTYQKETREQ